MGLLRRSRRSKFAELQPARSAPRRKTRWLKRLPWEFRLLLRTSFYLGLPCSALLACAFAYFSAAVPDPMQLRIREHAPIVRVLADDGSLLSERGSAESYVPIDFLPQHVIDAVIATEDRRFFEHRGVDVAGLLRAMLTNLRVGRTVQGGSTITQQLAKNLFLGPERTLTRKAAELVLALWLERRLSKRDILELYLNRVYFGAGAYGIDAAAHRFFGKPAQALTLAESAVLAGLLKAPSRFSPESNPQLARARAASVIAKMVEAGVLDAERAEQLIRSPVRFTALTRRQRAGVDYAVDAALDRLPALIGEDASEIVVETTIDAGLQRRAQAIVQGVMREEAHALGASQAALVLLEPEGAIRTIVGGRDYTESQFDRALKAKRQPGSAFKLFVYLAALESGFTPDSIVQDLPLLGSGWSPRNEGGGYRGNVTLRDAFAHSMNAAAARLHMKVGAGKTVAAARRLGIQSELRQDASLALGTSEVTLLELTGAYATIANAGRAVEPYVVRRVRTGAGKVLFERKAEHAARPVIAPAVVGALSDLLNAVVTNGTGKRALLADRICAGKTGTSQDFRDAWFIGYTSQLVGGVWVGNDDGRPMRKVTGGSLPAKLWHDVMVMAHEGLSANQLAGGGALPARFADAVPPPRTPIALEDPIRARLDELAVGPQLRAAEAVQVHEAPVRTGIAR